MGTNHYTPLVNRVRQLEEDQEQDALVVAISLHVAHDLQGMDIPAWVEAGFEDDIANGFVTGFNSGPQYAEKLATPLGRIKVLTFAENKWGEDAVRIWEGKPRTEPEYEELAKVRMEFPESDAFVGFVIDHKWDAPAGRWLYKVSLSEDDQTDDTFDNWAPGDNITRVP